MYVRLITHGESLYFRGKRFSVVCPWYANNYSLQFNTVKTNKRTSIDKHLCVNEVNSVDLAKAMYYRLSMYRGYTWYDRVHSTKITMMKRRSDLHSRKISHTSPFRVSSDVSFVIYTKKMTVTCRECAVLDEQLYRPQCCHHCLT